MPEDIEQEELPSEQSIEEQRPLYAKILEWILSHILPIVVSSIISIIVTYSVITIFARKVTVSPDSELEILPKSQPMAYFDLGEFNTLSADKDEPAFIKIHIVLAYDKNNKKLMTELNEKKPEIKDMVLTILSSKKQNDVDEPQKRIILKEEIRKTLNQKLLTQGEIKKVLFESFALYPAQ